MSRLLVCELEYEGTDFAGFQRQTGVGHAPGAGKLRTVQETVEAAIAAVTGEEVRITAAGRTDAGVHALGQVAHFRTESLHAPGTLVRALNWHLPPDVAVRSVLPVPEGFHARYSARSRVYRYTLYDTPARAPLLRRHALHVQRRLNVDDMQAGCAHLIGRHDFVAFAAAEDTANTTRTVSRAVCERDGPLVSVEIEADAFLRHMVRRVVGTLVRVGTGKLAPEAVAGILAGRDKGQAGPTAPPVGLCLVRVHYEGLEITDEGRRTKDERRAMEACGPAPRHALCPPSFALRPPESEAET